jgi:multisubunit Na+/H+ antiporter MnhB subunit
MGVIGAITDLLLYLAGAIAVVMIILGGIRYASSNGDQNAVTGAKNTIMYAVIGLVVTILAYAIVHFVLTNIK